MTKSAHYHSGAWFVANVVSALQISWFLAWFSLERSKAEAGGVCCFSKKNGRYNFKGQGEEEEEDKVANCLFKEEMVTKALNSWSWTKVIWMLSSKFAIIPLSVACTLTHIYSPVLGRGGMLEDPATL